MIYWRTLLNICPYTNLGVYLKKNFHSFFKNEEKNMNTQWLCALGLENGSWVDGRYLGQ